jgi:hypothetical protein
MEPIHLEKGETLFSEPEKVVCETGDFHPNDLVLVGELNNPIYPPDFPLYKYPAEYIKYGTISLEQNI